MKAFIQWLISLFFPTVPPTAPTPVVEPVIPPIAPIVPPAPQTPSKLDLWIKGAITMEGANPAHNNPGNVRYVVGTWMQKLATGEANGFCVFPTYEVGYHVLEQFFINAATGRSQIYSPTDSLFKFYSKYAPVGDGNNPLVYSSYVASIIAKDYPLVTANTLIKDLVY